MSSRWVGHPPAELHVECAGAQHVVRWEAGGLVALDHHDIEAERALAALARRPLACLRLLDAWHAHAADLRVLALASRGPGDTTAVGLPWGEEQLGASARTPSRVAFLVSGRSGAAANPAASGGQLHALALRFGHDPVTELVACTGPLADRLVATVAATWADRIDAGDPSADAQRPALTTALYGRVATALREWIGVAPDAVSLRMVEPGAERCIVRDGGDRIEVELPFAWLSEVWTRRLSSLLGRFVLGAEESTDGLRLQTLDHSLTLVESVAIALGPAPRS